METYLENLAMHIPTYIHTYIHTYNLYLYTIKNVKANKLDMYMY